MKTLRFPNVNIGKFNVKRSNMVGSSFERELPTIKPPLFHPEFNNGLVGTIHESYNNHIPVKLKPDHFWISIQMSLANYINSNSEKFQNILVSHDVSKDGKLVLVSEACPFDTPEHFIDEIFNEIVINSKVNPNIFIPKFSTTTQTDIYVSKAVFMGQMKSYFDYFSFGMCGIPEYQIMGTQKDWKDLFDLVDILDIFEDAKLSNWKLYLKFVFEHFIDLDPENPFWQKPYSYEYGGSGSDFITGWSGIFSPFCKNGRSNLLPFVRKKILQGDNSHIFVLTEDVVPTLFEIPVQKEFGENYKIIVGMILHYQESSNVISPECSYFVQKVNPVN